MLTVARSRLVKRPLGPSVVTKCPRSLYLLAQSARWSGISFGGIDLSHPTDPNRRKWIPILYNLALSLETLFSGIWFLMMNQQISYTRFMEEIYNAKPVLRYLSSSVIYLFALNGQFALTYLSYFNGRPLIAHLCALRSISGFDRDSSKYRLIAVRVFQPLALSFWLGIVATVYGYSSEMDLASLAHMTMMIFVKRIGHIVGNVASIFYLAIFVYVMELYRCQLKSLNSLVVDNGDGEYQTIRYDHRSTQRLIALRRETRSLELHFNHTRDLLQWPIAFKAFASIFTIIGSLCMLLIVEGVSTFHYTGYILMLFADSVVYLWILIVYGNSIHQQYRRLLHRIRRSSSIDWNLRNLLYYRRLAATSNNHFGQFRLRLYRTFSINQALFLSISTFILNYSVLLIQTDHSKSSSGPETVANQSSMISTNITS